MLGFTRTLPARGGRRTRSVISWSLRRESVAFACLISIVRQIDSEISFLVPMPGKRHHAFVTSSRVRQRRCPSLNDSCGELGTRRLQTKKSATPIRWLSTVRLKDGVNAPCKGCFAEIGSNACLPHTKDWNGCSHGRPTP